MPPIHAGGAWCGRMVPGGGFCPREEVFLWMRQEKCCRLSTQGVPGEDAWCSGMAFVHGRRCFCGCGKGNVAVCPRRGYLVWTHGARRCLLSTNKAISVDGNGLVCVLYCPWNPHCPGSPQCTGHQKCLGSGNCRGRVVTTQTARLQGTGRTCRRCG